MKEAHRRQHMGGIGALDPTFLDVALLAQPGYQQGKETMFCLMLDQARTEFGEDTEIETRVGQFQSKQIFEIHAGSYRICCLPIRQFFQILHKTDQSQPPGRFGWLASLSKQIGKLVISEKSPQFISQTHIAISFRKGCFRNTNGFFWNSSYFFFSQ